MNYFSVHLTATKFKKHLSNNCISKFRGNKKIIIIKRHVRHQNSQLPTPNNTITYPASWKKPLQIITNDSKCEVLSQKITSEFRIVSTPPSRGDDVYVLGVRYELVQQPGERMELSRLMYRRVAPGVLYC